VDVAVPTRTSLLIGWLVLLGVSSALFVLVATAAWWQHRREVPGRARRRAERAEWARHAATVTARARQAAAQLVAARERVAAAEHARAAAWRALEEVEAAHDEAARRLRERDPPTTAGSAGRAGRPEVTRAALAAYRRGDLTGEQLWRVWRWGSGWDPERDRCERELYRLRAARREAHLRYRAAAGEERAAQAEAEVAEVQARALAEEAVTAAAQAGWQDGPDESDERLAESR
jgi:hypothetical protein